LWNPRKEPSLRPFPKCPNSFFPQPLYALQIPKEFQEIPKTLNLGFLRIKDPYIGSFLVNLIAFGRINNLGSLTLNGI